MSIRHWPITERLREKLLAHGPQALSDAELLALFLGSGRQGRDAVHSARELLLQAGSLRQLLDLPSDHLGRLHGLGPARTCLLVGALELGQRHLAAALSRGETLSSAESAGAYFSRRLRARPHEVFAALFLDTRHRCIAFEELFTGTVDCATVYPREVVRRAIHHNAAAVIIKGSVAQWLLNHQFPLIHQILGMIRFFTGVSNEMFHHQPKLVSSSSSWPAPFDRHRHAGLQRSGFRIPSAISPSGHCLDLTRPATL